MEKIYENHEKVTIFLEFHIMFFLLFIFILSIPSILYNFLLEIVLS